MTGYIILVMGFYFLNKRVIFKRFQVRGGTMTKSIGLISILRRETIIGFILAFVALMAFPTIGHAAKPSSPIEVEIGFTDKEPKLDLEAGLFVRLSTSRDIPEVTVDLELPEELRQMGSRISWTGSLSKDKPSGLSTAVWILKPGRYSIAINVRCASDIPSPCSRRLHLNMIVTDKEVRSSMDPFILMDLERAVTPEQRQRLLRRKGIEVPTPYNLLPKDIPEPFAPKDTIDENGVSNKMIEPEAAVTVTVSGVMTYKDSAGVEHPIRFAKVEVVDVDGTTDVLMGAGSTATDGTYSISATGSDTDLTGPDIKVKVRSLITNNLVAKVGVDALSTYEMESAVNMDYIAPTLSVSLTTTTPVSGSTTDSIEARAFSVLDAMLQAAGEAYHLRDLNMMPEITVIFPVAGTASFYRSSDITLNILRADALDWDVLYHEYGHYLGDKGASSNFDNSPGGDHSGGSTIPLHGKPNGIRLAWGEGWATFFAIASQVAPTATSFGLVLPSIPNAGDRVYNDTEDGILTNDLETIGYGPLGDGYASEYSISSALYDLLDADVDISPDSAAKDEVTVSHKQIWYSLNTGDWDDVGKFYNYASSLFMTDPATQEKMGAIFAMNNIAPELGLPDDGDAVSSLNSPTFEWTANGDPDPLYEHDIFQLLIFLTDGTTNTLLHSESPITTTSHTLTDPEWQAIVQAGDPDLEYKWVVLGVSQLSGRMPPTGLGLEAFLSNAHTFTLGSMYFLPDTGQWQDFTSTYGEDSDFTIYPPLYIDNLDGTVTDDNTGLMWQKQDDGVMRTWYDAGSYCASLAVGGYSDWRLPERLQLHDIVDYGKYEPSIDSVYFPGTSFRAYWTNTDYAGDSCCVWSVWFKIGTAGGYGSMKTNISYTRCVRGDDYPTQNLTDNGDGTVSDGATGLMWQQGELDLIDYKSWDAALAYCTGLTLSGYADWRLPNVRELFTLIDDRTFNPAIDTTFFPYLPSEWWYRLYWTSTTDPGFPSRAYYINFDTGSVSDGGKEPTGELAVRCVR